MLTHPRRRLRNILKVIPHYCDGNINKIFISPPRRTAWSNGWNAGVPNAGNKSPYYLKIPPPNRSCSVTLTYRDLGGKIIFSSLTVLFNKVSPSKIFVNIKPGDYTMLLPSLAIFSSVVVRYRSPLMLTDHLLL